MTIEAMTPELRCRRTHWASSAALRLRYASVYMHEAVIEDSLSVEFQDIGFLDLINESTLVGRDPGVRVTSISGVNAAHLTLAYVDLSSCIFTGALHLDQLRLEGRCTFASAPAGWHRRGMVLGRTTPRRTLGQENSWRAHVGANGWSSEPHNDPPAAEPAVLAPAYRQLRKSLEDGKNEPDAADFYYGEMEMRRYDHDRPPGSAPSSRPTGLCPVTGCVPPAHWAGYSDPWR